MIADALVIMVFALQAVAEPAPPKPPPPVLQIEPRTHLQLAAQFEDLTWQPPPDFPGGPYRYRLHVPKSRRRPNAPTKAPTVYGERRKQKKGEPAATSESQKWPLLIWIHGEGPTGTDNVSQLSGLYLVLADPDKSAPFYILAPQFQDSNVFLVSDSPQKPSPLAVLDGLLQHVLDTYTIDPDRVYLTGLCSGGTACWEFAYRYPHRIAAMAPMQAPCHDLTRAALLKDIPVWTFFSSYADTPPDSTRQLVQAINDSGGIAWLSMTKQVLPDDHDSWTPAFEQYNVVNWLLAQRRGGFVWWRPGWLWYVPEWPWWQLPMWIGVIALAFFALRQERRRRVRARARRAEELNHSVPEEAITDQVVPNALQTTKPLVS